MKKKVLSLLLASAMVLSLASCDNQKAGGNEGSSESGSSEVTESTSESGNGEVTPVASDDDAWTVDYANNTVYAGSATTKLGSAGSGTLNYNIYAGQDGKDYTDPKVYTYHDYTAGMTNMKWSTHTWETSDDSYVLDLITSGFYDFQLNSSKDSWAIACEMAAKLPEDVTSQFVGQYGHDSYSFTYGLQPV